MLCAQVCMGGKIRVSLKRKKEGRKERKKKRKKERMVEETNNREGRNGDDPVRGWKLAI